MISHKLIIKEMPNGLVSVAMDPDQEGATKAEMEVAAIVNLALEAAGELLIKGTAVMVAGVGIKEHVKRFVDHHSRPR